MPRTLPLLVLLLFAATAAAQPSGTRLRGESDSGRTRKRLTEAQQKLADGQPAAADELQDILDQSGDDLVLVKDNHYLPSRRLVQQYLARLPEKPLATFRARIEEPAKKLLAAGKKARDPKPLRELAERYFVSRPAEEGLLLLGELEFERGEFVAAARHWRTLLPGDDDLEYPQPTTDPALVKAKLILARALGGDPAGAKADLGKFRTDHPKASGPLGGANGVYADTLAKLLEGKPVPPAGGGGWPSFAGGPTRDGRPEVALPRYLAGERPSWKAAIPAGAKEKGRPPASQPPARALAFHPVIANGKVYIADAGRVMQFDVKTGSSRVAYHAALLDPAPDFTDADFALPHPHDADFTLTAADGLLFARFGPSAMPTGTDDPPRRRTYLACLEPVPQADKLSADAITLKAKWQAAPPVPRGTSAAWGGAPVVADGRVYAEFVRAENGRLFHAVACYPLAGGEPLWVAELFDTDPRPATHRHELLTLAGGNIVCCSHAGVTVAVSAATGKPAWAFRNPPADRPPPASPRDLCPAVYHDGRVFLAPSDADAVFALDADTGRPLWTAAAGVQFSNLLGVSGGRLIATTHGKWNPTANKMDLFTGLRGFDTATGSDAAPVGWQQHDAPQLSNFGRGLAGSNLILYPARGQDGPQLNMLDAATGRPGRYTNARLPGNVAAADGVIAVATATEVWAYLFDGDAPVSPPPRGYPLVGVKDPPAFSAVAKVAETNTAFDPATALSLPASAVELKAANLPPLARPLAAIAPPRDAPVVLCDSRTLFAHDPDTGKELWKTPLDPPAVLSQVAFTTDGRVIAAGESAVIAVNGTSGKIAWQFRPPAADPTPPLSAFAFAGNRLVAKLGERGLIALDLGTGAVAWARSAGDDPAVDAYGLAAAPTFGPHLAAAGGRVFVQRDGECCVFDAATGERRYTFPTTVQEWTSPPSVAAGEITLPDAAGGVARFTRGQPASVFRPGRPASHSGVPPMVRSVGGADYVLVPRNVVDELYRLPSTDRRPALLPSGADMKSADADDERVYVPAGGKVFALNRDTLKEAWQTTLPDLPGGVRWRMLASRTTVVVVPTEAIRVEAWDAAGALSSLLTRPTPLRWVGTSLDLFDAATRYTLPVLVLESGTGKLVKRFEVPSGGPTVSVCPRSDGLLVVATGRAVWLGRK